MLRRHLFLRLHSAAGIPVARTYDRITKEANLEGAAVTRERLRDLLRHCQARVRFYRQFLHPDLIERDPFAALAEVPVLTRAMLYEHRPDLLSDDLADRRWHWNATGGSTGEPVRFVQDADFSAHATATAMRFHKSCGRTLGEPVVFLWGSEGEILKGRVALKSQLIRRLANETSINAFQIGEREVALFLSALERRSPKLIVAYAQSLYEVARLVSERSLRVRPPLAIITSAGTLYEFMRREIEQAFGCRVRNQYGSREIGPAALECEAGTGLHIAPWAVHAEVVGPNDESLEVGEEGELLVTSLTNYAMPLLRYAVGDRAALSRTAFCVCGHTGATLTRIAGRIVDSFLTRRGTIVDGEYFTHLLYHCDWVRQFQVVQRDHLDVVFRIVRTPGRAAPEAELDRIAAGTRAALGEECGVDFEFPDEVPPGPSGKFRFTISDVPRDAGRSKYGFES